MKHCKQFENWSEPFEKIIRQFAYTLYGTKFYNAIINIINTFMKFKCNLLLNHMLLMHLVDKIYLKRLYTLSLTSPSFYYT